MKITIYNKFSSSLQCDFNKCFNWYMGKGDDVLNEENPIGTYEISEPIGQGATARAFIINKYYENADPSMYMCTLKEFFPKKIDNGEEFPLLNEERRFKGNQYSEKDELKKRLKCFISSYDTILSFVDECKKEDSIINPKITPLEPGLYFTSIGVVYITKFENGGLLKDYFDCGSCNLENALRIVKKTLRNLKAYHQFNCLHADVKPSNFRNNDNDGENELSVRSVDFSSIIKWDILVNNIKIEKGRDLSILEKMFLPSFESTKLYYSYEAIKSLLKKLIASIKNNDNDKIDLIKNYYFSLDIVAAIKMLFNDGLKVELPKLCDKESVNRAKICIIDKFAQEKGFKSYHKAYLLIELLEQYCQFEEFCIDGLENCNNSKVFSLINKNDGYINIEQTLEDIITIFENENTLIYNHYNYCEYDNLLENGKTVADIVKISIDLFGEVLEPIKIIEKLMYE